MDDSSFSKLLLQVLPLIVVERIAMNHLDDTTNIGFGRHIGGYVFGILLWYFDQYIFYHFSLI